jgi:hypothetical protein
MSEKCKNCKYFKEGKYEKGECRIRAPRSVIYEDEGRHITYFPGVKFDDYCGDFIERTNDNGRTE